jgi:acetyl-CoA carboxylase biotin carboxylase subunit
MMISRVLVANRGEIALRILRTCRELGLSSVAVFSEADRDAPHVRYADEAYCIGPAAAQQSYLQGERIIEVAKRAAVHAIHPGYGFLAETPGFAQMCLSADFAFVGPLPETLRLLGDKARARLYAQDLGIPVLPGTAKALDDADLLSAAREIGYPVLVKAAAGGGGRGIRAAHSAAELEGVIPLARREAEGAFSDGTLYLERLVETARHIEVQILADEHGNVVNLGERECSIQRRHQKLIEEAPSRALSCEQRSQMCTQAVALAKSVNYVGAGTVEFLLEPSGAYYFLEVNPRLQVEHPVTEAVTGVDIVMEQLRIAAGRELRYEQSDLAPRGWAMECRIVAEDPFHGFAPSVGLVTSLREPGGPGIRVDSGIAEGIAVTPYYDSLLGKLVAWGETRGQAIVRMRRALAEYQILGVISNLELLRALLDSHRFFAGRYDTRFLEERFAPAAPEEDDYMAAAVTAAMLASREQTAPEVPAPADDGLWRLLGRWEQTGGGRR